MEWINGPEKANRAQITGDGLWRLTRILIIKTSKFLVSYSQAKCRLFAVVKVYTHEERGKIRNKVSSERSRIPNSPSFLKVPSWP